MQLIVSLGVMRVVFEATGDLPGWEEEIANATRGMTAGVVAATFASRFEKGVKLALFDLGSELHPNTEILKQCPDLDRPFYLRAEKAQVYSFRFSTPDCSEVLSYRLGTSECSVQTVRARISADLWIPADAFTISVGSRQCPEAEFLDSAVSYDISVRKSAVDELILQLHPGKPSPVFKRSLWLPRGQNTTVRMLLQDIKRYVPVKAADSLTFTIASQDVSLSPDVLLRNVRSNLFLIKYGAPQAGSVYTFRAPEFSEEVAVPAGTTLRTLSAGFCRHLAPKQCLASAFTFQFWRRALDLDHPFLDFGLPAGSEVTVSLDNTRDVIVQWPSAEQNVVVVGANDRVGDLRAFLATEKGVSATDILLRASNAELEDSRPLSELQSVISCSFCTHRFPFYGGEDFELSLPANATAADAAARIAPLFQTDASALVLFAGGRPLAPHDRLPGEVVKIGLRVRFIGADRPLDLELDYEMRFSAVRAQVEQALGADAVGLKFAWNGALIDDDMTVGDLLPKEVTVILPKVELREITAVLLIGIIPRTAKVKTRPADTLAAIEPTLRKRWELEDLEIEFVIGDHQLEDWRVVPLSTPIEEIDLENLTVGVRAASVNADGGQAAEPTELVVVDSNPGGQPFIFNIDGRRSLTLRFGPQDTVANAIERLARHLGLNASQIVLKAGERTLKERFILARMSKTDESISVCISHA
jgi:hypothetical protein